MQLNLTDKEVLALSDLLNTTIEGDRHPGSPRIQTLRGTFAKLGPMTRVLENRKHVKAEGVGAPATELDRRELEHELRSAPNRGEFDREVLERELRQSGPEGAAAAWGQVDAGLRAERANFECLRDRLLADPFDAPSWASEMCGVAVRWWAWETVRLYGEADGGRTWAALEAARADLRERLAGGRDDRGNPAHDALTADSWRVALDLVLRELDGFVGAHRAAIAAVYARAHHAGIA